MTTRSASRRTWRSYGTNPLPTAAEALIGSAAPRAQRHANAGEAYR